MTRKKLVIAAYVEAELSVQEIAEDHGLTETDVVDILSPMFDPMEMRMTPPPRPGPLPDIDDDPVVPPSPPAATNGHAIRLTDAERAHRNSELIRMAGDFTYAEHAAHYGMSEANVRVILDKAGLKAKPARQRDFAERSEAAHRGAGVSLETIAAEERPVPPLPPVGSAPPPATPPAPAAPPPSLALVRPTRARSSNTRQHNDAPPGNVPILQTMRVLMRGVNDLGLDASTPELYPRIFALLELALRRLSSLSLDEQLECIAFMAEAKDVAWEPNGNSSHDRHV